MGTEETEEVKEHDEHEIPYDTDEDFEQMAINNMIRWCEHEPPWDDFQPRS